MAAPQQRMRDENQSAILVGHAFESTYGVKKGGAHIVFLKDTRLPFPLAHCLKIFLTECCAVMIQCYILTFLWYWNMYKNMYLILEHLYVYLLATALPTLAYRSCKHVCYLVNCGVSIITRIPLSCQAKQTHTETNTHTHTALHRPFLPSYQ